MTYTLLHISDLHRAQADPIGNAELLSTLLADRERRSAPSRALEEGEYVLPARFDGTELPGLGPTIGYIDLAEFAPATLVDLLAEKLGEPQCTRCWPEDNKLSPQLGLMSPGWADSGPGLWTSTATRSSTSRM